MMRREGFFLRNPLFYGCGTALVTPFRGRRVDFDALENLIDWQLGQGVDALVLLGTTGEPATITPPERSAIIECAVARVGGRAPLIVGTGSNDTAAAVRQAREAEQLGADGLLVVTPYYNRASRRGLTEHYNAVADAVSLPIIMYNVPGRTGVNLEPATVAQLARHPNLCAVKDASGSLRQLTDLAAACGDGVAVYSGNDDQVVPALALGARGVISVASNVVPDRMHAIVEQWFRGDARASLRGQLECLPLIRALFREVSPIPVKAALSLLGRIENTLRLPLCPLDEAEQEPLRRAMRGLGLLDAPARG